MVESSGTGKCLSYYVSFHIETNKVNKIITDIVKFPHVG